MRGIVFLIARKYSFEECMVFLSLIRRVQGYIDVRSINEKFDCVFLLKMMVWWGIDLVLEVRVT